LALACFRDLFGSAKCNEKRHFFGRPAVLFTTPGIFAQEIKFLGNFAHIQNLRTNKE
jgi:hypothetical protein